jgi:hypothetical protein
MKVVEVPIVFVDRRVGQSKMRAADIAEAVVAPLKMRWNGRASG